tara:strand:+ start:50 stop:748 length:699 start_codon:yes stop_codon:yes gene_type:complete
MTTELERKMAEITARAHAQAAKLIEQEKEEKKADKKAVLTDWKARQKKRREAEHQARVKTGTELAEAFIQEVSGAYLRLVEDPENLKNLGSIRITFAPGKTDQAPKPSAYILDGGKRVSTMYHATLKQSREKETRELEKLRRGTMFRGVSPIDMMQEIMRLQGLLQKRDNAAAANQPIIDAAQSIMRAVTEERPLDEALDELELAFLPGIEREKILRARDKAAEQTDTVTAE